MPAEPSNALDLSRILLKAALVLNLAVGAVIVVAFAASLAFPHAFAAYFLRRGFDAALLLPTLRAWLPLGLLHVAALALLLVRLLELVATVKLGDPFVPDNAARLRTMAWCLLAMQLLHLANGIMVKVAAAADARIAWSFSFAGWIAVLLLFVLARVFEEGARLRGDLAEMI